MTDKDPLEAVREILDGLARYERTYHPNEPPFQSTFGALAQAIGLLADELGRQRDDFGISGGGIQVFDPSRGPGFE